MRPDDRRILTHKFFLLRSLFLSRGPFLFFMSFVLLDRREKKKKVPKEEEIEDEYQMVRKRTREREGEGEIEDK